MRIADLRRLFSSPSGYILLALYLGAFLFSFWLAFALRFDFDIPAIDAAVMYQSLPWVLALKLVCTFLLGGFHGRLRYVTFHDLLVVVRLSVVASAAIVIVDYYLFHDSQIPRAVVPLDCAISILLLGGIRSLGRVDQEILRPLIRMHLLHDQEYRRALLVGANRTGVTLANQLHIHPKLDLRVVAFLDPDPAQAGGRLGGIPVLGTLASLEAAARRCDADEVLVIADTLPGRDVRSLMNRCQQLGLTLKVIPNVGDLVHRAGHMSPLGLQLRDVDIDDLLRREPVELDTTIVEQFVAGRLVLVTGAGGSIGSEICRQLIPFRPRALVLVEQAENNLFQIDRELRLLDPLVAVHPCVADVTDEARMRQVFSAFRPDVVFHAAAHKHVPMMEANPGEAIKNNVFGTRVTADLAHEFGLQSFVMISTDKAVNPSSVMGLSKQIAERYVHAISQVSSTRFVSVRFGNVLGSTGSVVPIFQEQIRAGGPITITHPEMRRFFMTIPEASQLVLQAGAMGKGGEIFVLDMGDPVRIVDLAHDLIRLSGLSLDEIEIVFTGTRPGEKLFEELYLDEEQTLPTPHPKVRAAFHKPYTLDEVRQLLGRLARLVEQAEPAVIRRQLQTLVPEFGSAPSAVGPPAAASPTAWDEPSTAAPQGQSPAEVRTPAPR